MKKKKISGRRLTHAQGEDTPDGYEDSHEMDTYYPSTQSYHMAGEGVVRAPPQKDDFTNEQPFTSTYGFYWAIPLFKLIFNI